MSEAIRRRPRKVGMPSHADLQRLRNVIDDLKVRGLDMGRYDPPFTPRAWDERGIGPVNREGRRVNRDGAEVPFRCGAYSRIERQIPALERVLRWAAEERDEMDRKIMIEKP